MKLSQLKQQIEELDAKATKGPWFVEDGGEFIATKKHGRSFDIAIVPDYLRQGEYANSDRDADFIALSRTALPELLRRLLVAEEAMTVIYGAADDSEGPSDDPIAQAYNAALNVIIAEVESALATIRGEEE